MIDSNAVAICMSLRSLTGNLAGLINHCDHIFKITMAVVVLGLLIHGFLNRFLDKEKNYKEIV